MSNKELYRDDLISRYASHTFTETVINDMTKVEFKDASGNVIGMKQTMDVNDAYQQIRYSLVGGPETLPEVTTTQRDALTDTKDGCLVLNTTTNALNVCSAGVWR